MKTLSTYGILAIALIVFGACKKQKPPKGEYSCSIVRTVVVAPGAFVHRHFTSISITQSKKNELTVESGEYVSVLSRDGEHITGALKVSLPTNDGFRIYDPLNITATISRPCDKFVIKGTFNAIYKFQHKDSEGNDVSGEESLTGTISIVEK
jgi:hypothetical protein